ncbi:hypothetical protein [Oceanobacillus jeddahense]|uniref:hypothetical protein n=1 Tax=Oceanobacillus jeddahense TaxID=1462527 RepID=UPI000595C1FE|nr:hypothetical protein [Oceanobacillus jeddahense]
MFNITQCDECNGLIFPKQMQVQDKEIKPGKQMRYWNCPVCNHQHVIMIMDKTSRRLMQQNKKDNEKISGIHKQSTQLRKANQLTESKTQSFLNQIDTIQQRIDKRKKDIDQRSKKLLHEYQEALQ